MLTLTFKPTNEEVFGYYLRPAIDGEPLCSKAVTELEIYGEDKEPWKIFDKDEKKSLWVFTNLKEKNKSRIDRTAGCGYWKARLNKKEVKDARGQQLGLDKYFFFTFKKDQSNEGNGHWIMHEYSLNDEGLNDYVICKIKNKNALGSDHQDQVEPSNKKRQTVEVSDEEM
ncbi:NAC transcription factor 32-like [Durio zibethinus]|uniref:NAC transcription factor 32-like n=1 Tax=Durio zibethinus TaxID=66656 RepID=A0A6P5X648_DURZI|nr:NAC transcription factor 32-like [Durio zibethinus]